MRKLKSWVVVASIVIVLIVGALSFRSIMTGMFIEDAETASKTGPYDCSNCNVLIITTDTLRAQNLGMYGYERDTSPYLDKFADGNILFERAYVQIPFTAPSHWSIFTGLYAHNHQIWNYWEWRKGEDDDTVDEGLPEDIKTSKTDAKKYDSYESIINSIINKAKVLPFLPAILSEQNYSTVAFTSSAMVRTLEPFFDSYTLSHYSDSSTGSYATTHKTMQWLEDNGSSNKFLLWVHYWDVHSPYAPIAEYDIFESDSEDRFAKDEANYDGEIRFLDYKINMILEKLDELELSNETIVIIVGDHGENFGEYDCSEC